MTQYPVKILGKTQVTHNVCRFTVEKPEGFDYEPGQATDIALDKEGWREEKHPFTFTNLPEENYLEFTIKIYDDHDGVTHNLDQLKEGDTILLHDIWGAITYKGTGVFIAGGAGVTPFIAILRSLKKKAALEGHTLIFGNQTEADIIDRDSFNVMLGDNFINILSKEKKQGCDYGRIDEAYLKEKITDFDQWFYICGPDEMVESVQKALQNLGASNVVVEQFD